MKKLMIVSYHSQFGYHTDMYNYVLNLKSKFKIIFISIDLGEKKINLDGVEIIYFSISCKYKILTKFNVKILIKNNIEQYNPEYVFIQYYPLCSLLRGIKGQQYIIDYRTLDISNNKAIAKIKNMLMGIEGRGFNNRCVITEKIGLKLKFDNFKVIPVGGKSFKEVDLSEKLDFEVLKFIYVGTFYNRRVEDIVKAFNRLCDKYDGNNVELLLIGDSHKQEEVKVIKTEINKNHHNKIQYLGKVNNEELGDYFKTSNIGISYIPITNAYDLQPPTKTFEYLFNGLYTIGTETAENCNIINESNGILIRDNVESLFKAMDYLYNKRLELHLVRSQLKDTVKKNEWSIIANDLYEYIERLI